MFFDCNICVVIFLMKIEIKISIIKKNCIATVHTGKSETWQKTTEAAFCKWSANKCFVKLSNIQKKGPKPESHLNIVEQLQPETLLREKPQHQCFSVITLHTFKFSGAWKFLMTVLIKTCERKLF